MFFIVPAVSSVILHQAFPDFGLMIQMDFTFVPEKIIRLFGNCL